MKRLNVYAASGESFHSTLTVFVLESSGALHLAGQGNVEMDGSRVGDITNPWVLWPGQL